MNKMKKGFILLGFIFASFVFVSQVFAVNVSTSTKFRARAVMSEPELEIVHTPVAKVSSVAKEMVVVGSVNVGNSPNYLSELKIIYTLPGGTEITEDISFGSNLGDVAFSKRITFTQESGTIAYKIRASAVIGVSISTETSTNYAVISSSVSSNVGTSGATVSLESGNQLYGNTKIVIPSGALASATDISITEVDPAVTADLSISKAATQETMLTCFDIMPDITLNAPAVLTLYYGSRTSSQNIKIKRFSSSQWIDVSTATVNFSSRTASVSVTQLGRYAAFAGSGFLPDNEYRPRKRVVVVGRSVFEFNNLMSGDVVKIYNINGKKIKEITSGDAGGFEWDGKKDDGTWAESGAYIYQIKIEGKSKLISGTIAFVR